MSGSAFSHRFSISSFRSRAFGQVAHLLVAGGEPVEDEGQVVGPVPGLRRPRHRAGLLQVLHVPRAITRGEVERAGQQEVMNRRASRVSRSVLRDEPVRLLHPPLAPRQDGVALASSATRRGHGPIRGRLGPEESRRLALALSPMIAKSTRPAESTAQPFSSPSPQRTARPRAPPPSPSRRAILPSRSWRAGFASRQLQDRVRLPDPAAGEEDVESWK